MAGQGVSNHESTVNAAGYERLPAPTPDGLADAEAQLLDDTTVEELCEHVHHSNRAPWLRALVLGANDGLVSVAALLIGVTAGSSDLAAMRLSGIAGIVGGALSMAVGEYISVSSQRDAEEADIMQERLEQLKGPDARAKEQTELAQIYVDRGLPPNLAAQVAQVLSNHHLEDVVRTHARDELGIDVDELARPLQAAVVSALCFTSGGLMPLLAAAFVHDQTVRLIAIAGATTLGLVLFGVLGAFLGGAHKIRGAARVVLGGWLALGVVYGIGNLLGVEGAA
ncbi:CVL1 [Auxenochlorella protothecoides x Auxenochlorella symbiontica]